jgi:hypothetical protein
MSDVRDHVRDPPLVLLVAGGLIGYHSWEWSALFP